MVNERKTEQLVRNMLKDRGYLDNSLVVVEEQASDDPRIDKLLKFASKAGTKKGYPEFIISFKNNPSHVIIIECKADISKHESKDKKHYKDYAVDGVLLYASYLKDTFNVTAIAVSGENEREKKISSFLWLKGNYTYKNIQDKTLLSPDEISSIVIEQSKPISEDELIKRAIEYNSFLHRYSIPEVERCTLISAILIALQDKPFLSSYREYTSNKDLIDNLIEACKRVLKNNELAEEKTVVIIGEYSKFKNNDSFNSQTFYNKKNKKDEVNTILRDFIILINENILPYINTSQFDVLGKFYTQFIRYAGSDKKTGLVLTPSHITDFFCDIADLTTDDIVFDECCGTAGFLVSAMNYMLKKAGNDSVKKQHIKSSQLLGIEARPDMFSHACSNMMMRGDGKSHILYGDCFRESNKNIIKAQYPTKAFLNPPYQDGNADEQLEFIENALECLVKDGICIAICQMSTIVSSKREVVEVRERILQKHTLEATFSMPDDLFYPVGVNTAILVFKAHSRHPKGKKSFFGYFKDDGFVKTKHEGRINNKNKWANIKREWVNAYMNKETIVGLSVMQEVTASDEWCAEAYIETDYSTIDTDKFIKVIKDHVSFMFHMEYIEQATKESCQNKIVDLNGVNWDWFYLNDLFNIEKGERLTKSDRIVGEIPLVTAVSENNGVVEMIDYDTFKDEKKIYSDKITIDMFFNTFYHSHKYFSDDNVHTLIPKVTLNVYVSMFLVTIFRFNMYKYAYGRQVRIHRLEKEIIKLPVNKDGLPDWAFMEYFIKSLPYSANLINKIELKNTSNALSDEELIAKYESGSIDLVKTLKPVLKK